MTSSWRSVTSFSCANSAATMTKKKMPPTHAAIAVSDFRVGECPLTRALSSVVMTSAMAPSGCTTISGATASAPSWQTIAIPSMSVPTTQDGRVSRRPSCLAVSPEVASRPLRRSTFATPRCWYCAPKDMNTAPARASGMPSSSPGFWNTPTS